MVRTVSSTEAKNHFGAIAESVKSGNCEVIVENRGEPLLAIIPISRYEDLARFDKEQRRKDAVARIRQLRRDISERSADMTDEEKSHFVEELVGESAQSLVAKGIIRYKER